MRLTIALCILGVGLSIGCTSPEERKIEYRARAQSFIEQGNYPKARVALRNVLKIDPRDAEAYFLFAQVEEKERNWPNAFANYQRVVELVPDHEAALIRLGKFYLEGRAPEKVTEISNRVLAKTPDHAQAQSLKIAVLALSGDIPQAVAQAERLLTRHPNDQDVSLLLASLYRSQQRIPEAELILRRSLTTHPQDLELLTLLAGTLTKAGKYPDAEQTLRRLIELDPQSLEPRVRLAAFYDQQKHIDQAEATLREAVQLAPQNEQRHMTLVEYVAVRKGIPQAEAALLDARAHLPRSTTLQFALGKLYESSQQIEKARAVYHNMRDELGTKPAGLDARVKLASLDLLAGQKSQAEQQLQEVFKENPRSAEGLLLRGRIALSDRNGKDAVQAFRTALKDQPDRAEIYSLLGQAHLVLGEQELARESLEQAVLIDPRRLEDRRILAGIEAGAGRLKEARQRLEENLRQEPSDIGSLGLLLNLQVGEKDWAVTEQTVTRLRAAGAGEFAISMTEGNLYQVRRQWDRAVASYERALAANPNAPDPLAAIIRIQTARGELPQARKRLETIVTQRPNDPYAHGILGEVLLLQKDEAGAEAKFHQATQLKPEWTTPWINWAALKFRQQQIPQAEEVLQAGLRANPQADDIRLLLATRLMEREQVDQAITEYEAVLKRNPDALVAANNLAMLLTDKKGDPKSLERALALSRNFEKQTQNPFFLDTLGWVHLKMGHGDDAVRVMKLALAKAPDQPLLNYHLGLAYRKHGDLKSARTHLQKAVAQPKGFAEIEDARAVLAEL